MENKEQIFLFHVINQIAHLLNDRVDGGKGVNDVSFSKNCVMPLKSE